MSTSSTPELRKLILQSKNAYPSNWKAPRLAKALEIALDALDEIKSHSSNCYICDAAHIAKVNLTKCEAVAKGDL